MEEWLEELHNDFVNSTEYYPRTMDIEYEWWALECERPHSLLNKNEDCK